MMEFLKTWLEVVWVLIRIVGTFSLFILSLILIYKLAESLPFLLGFVVMAFGSICILALALTIFGDKNP